MTDRPRVGVMITRPHPECPECGWQMRPTPDGDICDICHLIVIRE